MLKLDLKDAYFSVPLDQHSQKYVRFKWDKTLYQFQCLCFGLSPAPRVFSKILKVPISLLRRLGVRLIIFLDDILLVASTPEELRRMRDTTIFLLQSLGFLINVKKSVFEPTQKIEFLGMVVDSVEMTLSLPEEKVIARRKQCSEMLEREKVPLRELSKLVGRLSASMLAILPAPLQYRGLQRQQIFELKEQGSYDHLVELTVEVKEEINWWLCNLDLYNGRSLITPPPQIVIQTDASKTGWGAACRNLRTGGPWSQEE